MTIQNLALTVTRIEFSSTYTITSFLGSYPAFRCWMRAWENKVMYTVYDTRMTRGKWPLALQNDMLSSLVYIDVVTTLYESSPFSLEYFHKNTDYTELPHQQVAEDPNTSHFIFPQLRLEQQWPKLLQ